MQLASVRIMRYEIPSLCSAFGRNRADLPALGPPLSQCFYRAPLPGPAAQRPGLAPLANRRRTQLRHPDRPRRPTGFRPTRPGLPVAAAQDTQDHPHRLAPGSRRRSAGLAASVPAHSWQADQPVDAAASCSGLLRKRLDHAPTQRRGHPPGTPALGGRLEAGQALADQPRSRVRAKKKCAIS